MRVGYRIGEDMPEIQGKDKHRTVKLTCTDKNGFPEIISNNDNKIINSKVSQLLDTPGTLALSNFRDHAFIFYNRNGLPEQ